MRRVTTSLLAATFFLLLPAGALAAGGGTAAVEDCQDGRIDGTYTAAEYRDALKSIPTDVDEYTDCRDVLRAAQLRAAGTPTKPGPAPSSAPAAPGAEPAVASPGSVPPESSAGGSAPSAGAPSAPGAPAAGANPVPSSAVSSQAPGTAPPPRIPGLPVDGAPVAAGGTQDAGALPTAAASRATEELPPTLAFLLVLAAAGLLAVGALRARRSRHAAG